MDFKDPFANDLRNFNAVSSGLGRNTITTTTTMGGGRGILSGAGEAPVRNRGGASIFDTGASLSSPSLGSGGLGTRGGEGGGGSSFQPFGNNTTNNTSTSNKNNISNNSNNTYDWLGGDVEGGSVSLGAGNVMSMRALGPRSRSGGNAISNSNISMNTNATSPTGNVMGISGFGPAAASAPRGRRGVGSSVTWVEPGADPFGISLPPPQPQSQVGRPAAISNYNASDDFLNFLEDPNPSPPPPPAVATSARGMAPTAAQGAAGAYSHSQQQLPLAPSVDPAVAEAALKKEKEAQERRELLGTLGALVEEEAKLSAKLDTKEIEEEAELMKLETAWIEKDMELQQKEKEKETKIREIREYTERQLREMKERQETEKLSLKESIWSTEKERYERQLKQLNDAYASTTASLRDLRRERALFIVNDPLSETGLTLQLSSKMEKSMGSRRPQDDRNHSGSSSTHQRGEDGEEKGKEGDEEKEYNSHDEDFDSSSSSRSSGSKKRSNRSGTSRSSNSKDNNNKDDDRNDDEDDATADANALKLRELEPEEEMECAMRAAVDIVKEYCDAHLVKIRDRVVGHVHDASLATAHESQLNRLHVWEEETAQRKQELHSFSQEMMTSFLQFYRQRAELKQQNLKYVRDEISRTGERFREEAKQRLSNLLTDITAKLQAATEFFEKQTQENVAVLERKAAAIRLGDYHVAEAQLKDARQRCQLEDSVRQQLYQSQRHSLEVQLQRLRQSGDCISQEQSQALRTKSLESSTAVERLREQLSELQAKIEIQLRETNASSSRNLFSSTNAKEGEMLSLQLEDLHHSISALVHAIQDIQERNVKGRLRFETTQGELLYQLDKEILTVLNDRRLLQQSEGARLDHMRLSWEKEHRANLAAPHHFEVELLPGAPNADCSVLALSSAVHPQLTILSGLLELLSGALRVRDGQQRELRERRGGQMFSYEKELSRLSQQYRHLVEEWDHYGEVLAKLETGGRRLLNDETTASREVAVLQGARQALEERWSELDRRRKTLDRRIEESRLESEKVAAAYEKEEAALIAATHERLQTVEKFYKPTDNTRSTGGKGTRRGASSVKRKGMESPSSEDLQQANENLSQYSPNLAGHKHAAKKSRGRPIEADEEEEQLEEEDPFKSSNARFKGKKREKTAKAQRGALARDNNNNNNSMNDDDVHAWSKRNAQFPQDLSFSQDSNNAAQYHNYIRREGDHHPHPHHHNNNLPITSGGSTPQRNQNRLRGSNETPSPSLLRSTTTAFTDLISVMETTTTTNTNTNTPS